MDVAVCLCMWTNSKCDDKWNGGKKIDKEMIDRLLIWIAAAITVLTCLYIILRKQKTRPTVWIALHDREFPGCQLGKIAMNMKWNSFLHPILKWLKAKLYNYRINGFPPSFTLQLFIIDDKKKRRRKTNNNKTIKLEQCFGLLVSGDSISGYETHLAGWISNKLNKSASSTTKFCFIDLLCRTMKRKNGKGERRKN